MFWHSSLEPLSKQRLKNEITCFLTCECSSIRYLSTENNRQGVVLQLGGGWRYTNSSVYKGHHPIKCMQGHGQTLVNLVMNPHIPQKEFLDYLCEC